jgi:hypothetical protein
MDAKALDARGTEPPAMLHWKALCSKQRYWRSATATVRGKAKLGPLSHSSYEGGTLCVPQEGLEELYSAIARDIEAAGARTRFYLTEFHTPTFPLFFDIDLKRVDEALRPAIHAGLRRVIPETVAKFYREAEPRLFDAIWCAAEAASPLSGLHVYMWRLVVDAATAVVIRHAVVVNMRARHPGLLPKENAWEDVIDGGVYGKGLRMPGAAALRECDHCKAATGDRADPQCPFECNRGKVWLGRRYVFHELVAAEDSVDTEILRNTISGNWAALLRHTCLRTTRPVTPGYAVYPGCPLPDDRGHRKTTADCLPPDHPAMPGLLDAVRGIKPCYGGVVIDRVARLERGALYRVYVSGENAKWCENKGGYHASSRVTFEVRVSGVRIRCGCRKADLAGRRFGPCKDYVTQWVDMAPPLRALLFPNKGPAVSFARAMKRRRGSASTARNYLAQGTELGFGKFMPTSRESSANSSAAVSRTPSVVAASPRVTRLDEREVSRRLGLS